MKKLFSWMLGMIPGRSALLKMVIDAHAACRSESMCCPWCSGYVSSKMEEHDQFCPWPKLRESPEVVAIVKEQGS